LSCRLNEKYTKVTVDVGGISNATNHLLFIDDLKLLATNEEVMRGIIEEVKAYFAVVGLEINSQESATNEVSCTGDVTLLEGTADYKYLGVIEDSKSRVSRESFDKLKAELLLRVKRLCKSKLNAKNLFKAINEHVISLINYYVGVLKLEPDDYVLLDTAVRQILITEGIHLQPGCKERLYLPRTELGRGLQSIEHRSENMLYQLHQMLDKQKLIFTRRATILKAVERMCKSLVANYISIPST